MSQKTCPLMGGPCIEHQCKWYVHLLGAHPQKSGETIDQFDCAVSFLPILMVNIGKQANDLGSAVESFRNKVVEQSEKTEKVVTELVTLAKGAQRRALEDRG